MRKDYTVNERVNNRGWFYEFLDTNAKGETVCFELVKMIQIGKIHFQSFGKRMVILIGY